MQEIEVARVLPAPVSDVEPILSPEAIIRYEGSHEPDRVSESDGRTVVRTRPSGRPFELTYVFEATNDGVRYQRDWGKPPLVVITTRIALESRADEAELSVRSTIEPTLPIPFLGRYAAWRRRRTLTRLCDRIVDELARSTAGDQPR